MSFTGTFGNGSGLRYIHRKNLLQALADELPIDTIHFSCKIAAIETQTHDGSSPVIIHLGDGTLIKAKVLIGCDGVHSMVARWLGLSAPVKSGRSAGLGMAVFPEGHGLSHEVRQFIDVGLRAGYVPLNDKEIYWFLTCNSPPKGENLAGNPELLQKEVLDKYAKVLPPLLVDIIQKSDLSTLHWAPLMFRHPWNMLIGNLSKGNITVAGDAMHPMTPDLGQGGCSALEDAVVLGRHIGNSFIKNKRLVTTGDNNVGQAIDEYVKERKWRVTGLITGSYLSGWVQNGGSKWWMKFLRDVIFYRLFFGWILSIAKYDCGKLPSVSPAKPDKQSKLD
uniref:Zeaxanthin epoxidase n=1 Tax=Phellodendron amurense TaxID=68554 RepID=A0A2C9PIM4_PHEAM|nr:zeaxanthin epoxidase [Phellodendron amurense]